MVLGLTIAHLLINSIGIAIGFFITMVILYVADVELKPILKLRKVWVTLIVYCLFSTGMNILINYDPMPPDTQQFCVDHSGTVHMDIRTLKQTCILQISK